jgi:hypothetical protein
MNQILSCPHCKGEIIILKLNCKIFRHAVFKDGKQLNPHASKEECERVVRENLVYGCAKPFQIIDGKAIKCDYI